jgi:hypothetical protein
MELGIPENYFLINVFTKGDAVSRIMYFDGIEVRRIT